MDKIHKFKKENIISFSNRKELIQFVSKYFANQYEEHCELWKATAMDSPAEMVSWDVRRENESPRLQKALIHFLSGRRYFKKDFKFTSQSVLFKKAFKRAKMSCNPINCIPVNVEYEIKGLVFSRDVKSRPI